jgi:hypothetical protein
VAKEKGKRFCLPKWAGKNKELLQRSFEQSAGGLERNPKRKISQAVKLQAAYYFGGLEKAIVALKKDQRFLSGWSKTKIIKILSQMHRSKENLAYANMRHKFPALLSAAEAYFGSWGKALYAAGIDPNEYFVRRAWHQRKK